MTSKIFATAAAMGALAVSGAALAQEAPASDAAPAAAAGGAQPGGSVMQDVSAQPGVQEPAVVPGTTEPPQVGTSGAVGQPTDAAMAPAAAPVDDDDDGFPWGLLGLLGLAGLLGLKRRDEDRTRTNATTR